MDAVVTFRDGKKFTMYGALDVDVEKNVPAYIIIGESRGRKYKWIFRADDVRSVFLEETVEERMEREKEMKESVDKIENI